MMLEEGAAYTKEMHSLDGSILWGITLRQLEWYEEKRIGDCLNPRRILVMLGESLHELVP